MTRLALGVLCAIVALTWAVETAAATITIGPQTLSSQPQSKVCRTDNDLCTNGTFLQKALDDPGATVAAPYDGTIVGWRTFANVSGTAQARLRVVRRNPGGPRGGYTPADESAPGSNFAGGLNPASVPIRAGDLISIKITHTAPGTAGVHYAPGGGQFLFWQYGFETTSSSTPAEQPGVLMFNAELQTPPPAVTGVSPNFGPAAGDQLVTITGSRLSGTKEVRFGDVPSSSFSVFSDTEIKAVTPPHATGTVDVTVTGPGGDVSSASDAGKYTFVAPAGGPPPPDVIAPAISNLRLSPKRFEAANTGPATTAAAVGTRVTYTQTEAGTTVVTFQRARPGRKRRGRCVRPRKAPRGKRCTRWVTIPGSITLAGTAGQNSFRFMGRLGNKALKPGRYRLRARATDGAGNKSERRRTPFRIVR